MTWILLEFLAPLSGNYIPEFHTSGAQNHIRLQHLAAYTLTHTHLSSSISIRYAYRPDGKLECFSAFVISAWFSLFIPCSIWFPWMESNCCCWCVFVFNWVALTVPQGTNRRWKLGTITSYLVFFSPFPSGRLGRWRWWRKPETSKEKTRAAAAVAALWKCVFNDFSGSSSGRRGWRSEELWKSSCISAQTLMFKLCSTEMVKWWRIDGNCCNWELDVRG